MYYIVTMLTFDLFTQDIHLWIISWRKKYWLEFSLCPRLENVSSTKANTTSSTPMVHFIVINGGLQNLASFVFTYFRAAMQLQMLLFHLMIWSLLNVHCEELVTSQPYIYDTWGYAKVNFFTKESFWTYAGCMKHCQNMGGRSPPVRTKEELDEMKGMLSDLRAFPPYPVNCICVD